MTQRNQIFNILLIYLIILFLPSFFIRFNIFPTSTLTITTISDLLGALGLSWLALQLPKNSLEQPTSQKISRISWGILGIVLVLLGQIIAGVIDRLLFKGTMNSLNTDTLITAISKQPLFIFATTIAAPVMEEIVFRKVGFGQLIPRMGKIGAAIFSSLLFALAHNDGHLIVYLTIGLILCWLYQKAHSLVTTIISHAGMNLLVVLLYLLH